MNDKIINGLALVLALTSASPVIAHPTMGPLTEAFDSHTVEGNAEQPIVEWRGNDAVIWVSNIAPIIFGMDATGYDYEMVDCGDRPIEAVKTLNHTVHSQDSKHAVMVALLNTTMGGTMTKDQGRDIKYLCSELGLPAAAQVPECKGVKW